MKYRSRYEVCAALLAAACLLSGCDSFRDAAGISKDAPDEFAVATKAPLVIPPDFNLVPPKPGAPPANQLAPTDTAQSALFNTDPASVASGIKGDFSQGERMLLATAGAANVDHTIRQQIASDGRAMQAADDDFTNQVLFWQSPKTDEGTNVDADAEAARVQAQKAAGQPQSPAAATSNQQPVTTKKEEEKSGGWFDGIF